MVSSSVALATHMASFRAFRNFTYNGESSVTKSKLKGPYYSQESRDQSTEGQVRRGIGSGG